jgi:hypothetical protein
MPTSENPYIDPAEIEAASLDLTESAFNQEYLALFVNWEGRAFRRVGEAATVMARMNPEAGHDYAIGCDWADSNDYTVFLVLDATAHAVVALDRSNRVDYALQCERLKALCEKWQPQQIIAEQNSIGQRMHSGRLKVFASLSKYLDERRLYRRDERDQIVKDRDNLQDALRCLVSGISRMRTKPQPAPAVTLPVYHGSTSWMR